MNTYIADRKFEFVVVLQDKKTPGGAEMVQVTFEDGTSEIMPKARFELIVSEEKSDATGVNRIIRNTVGSRVFAVLHEFGIRVGEIDLVLDEVAQLTNSGISKAVNTLLKIEDKNDLSLIQVNEILLENVQRTTKSTDDASSLGDGTDSENKE